MQRVAAEGGSQMLFGGGDALRRTAVLVAIGVTCWASGWIVLGFEIAGRTLAPIWPPAGIGLAAAFFLGGSVWPAIATAALVLALQQGFGIVPAAGVAAGETFQALAGAWILRRWIDSRAPLERVREVLALALFGAALAPAAGASIAALSLELFESGGSFAHAWLDRWTGSAGGVLVFGASILAWSARARLRLSLARAAEAAALVLTLLLVATLTYGSWLTGELRPVPLSYLAFPPFIWAALRFGQLGATGSTMAISCVATWSTAHGLGPFAMTSAVEGLTFLASFIAASTLTSMLLAATRAERESVERSRREGALRYRALSESSTVGIWQITLQGRTVYANRAMLAMLEVDGIEDLAGTTHRDFVNPEHHASMAREHEKRRMGIASSYEVELVGRRGSRRNVVISGAPVRAPGGDVVGMVGTFMDVTERRRLEAQLLHAQRLESIGRLAGGVAHDFNNLLTAILGYAELARIDLPEGHPARASLRQVQAAAERATALTRQLLAFARRQVIAPARLDLNQLVLDLHSMLERLLGEDIELATRTEAGLWPVRADASQIEQVVLNLAVNARDAMPGGGRLVVQTSNAVLERTIDRGEEIAPGRYVLLEVSDTGCGMDESTLARAFEPFFTTKPQGRGTGLGLSTCYGIVRQSGGHVFGSSEPGRGTTFKVFLPIAAGEIEEPLVAEPHPEERGEETVLLVEDDALVREVAVLALRSRGYTVLEAANGLEALERSREHAGEIALLVSDMLMPGMGGRELAERLERERPEVRVLFVTGFTEDESLLEGGGGEERTVLQKPFTASSLARKVRQVLGAAQGASTEPG
ncbi:MAG TPA: MASE1 domain-containing protein [Planctomycetota bacterium]|nr:MASE1 domain-containing protein [Planctomycetota bacterium]